MASRSEAPRGPSYRLGWNVGAWHCDHGRSRDALVLLEVADGMPRLSGRPWRGNLKDTIRSRRGVGLIDALLDLASPKGEACLDLAIAIDAPLGWPDAMVELVVMGLAAPEIAGHGDNRYLFRETESALVRRGFRTPLSAVQDMLGSQSTKALHFLRAAGFEREDAGVWHLDANGRRASAVETYPAVIETARQLRDAKASIESSPAWRALPKAGEDAEQDIGDALSCAVLAHLWADRRESCEPIPEHASLGEGWIVVPTGISA